MEFVADSRAHKQLDSGSPPVEQSTQGLEIKHMPELPAPCPPQAIEAANPSTSDVRRPGNSGPPKTSKRKSPPKKRPTTHTPGMTRRKTHTAPRRKLRTKHAPKSWEEFDSEDMDGALSSVNAPGSDSDWANEPAVRPQRPRRASAAHGGQPDAEKLFKQVLGSSTDSAGELDSSWGPEVSDRELRLRGDW